MRQLGKEKERGRETVEALVSTLERSNTDPPNDYGAVLGHTLTQKTSMHMPRVPEIIFEALYRAVCIFRLSTEGHYTESEQNAPGIKVRSLSGPMAVENSHCPDQQITAITQVG